jgi:hypothetical protein
MKSGELRSLPAPLKEQYKINPEKTFITLTAEVSLRSGITCNVKSEDLHEV